MSFTTFTSLKDLRKKNEKHNVSGVGDISRPRLNSSSLSTSSFSQFSVNCHQHLNAVSPVIGQNFHSELVNTDKTTNGMEEKVDTHNIENSPKKKKKKRKYLDESGICSDAMISDHDASRVSDSNDDIPLKKKAKHKDCKADDSTVEHEHIDTSIDNLDPDEETEKRKKKAKHNDRSLSYENMIVDSESNTSGIYDSHHSKKKKKKKRKEKTLALSDSERVECVNSSPDEKQKQKNQDTTWISPISGNSTLDISNVSNTSMFIDDLPVRKKKHKRNKKMTSFSSDDSIENSAFVSDTVIGSNMFHTSEVMGSPQFCPEKKKKHKSKHNAGTFSACEDSLVNMADVSNTSMLHKDPHESKTNQKGDKDSDVENSVQANSQFCNSEIFASPRFSPEKKKKKHKHDTGTSSISDNSILSTANVSNTSMLLDGPHVSKKKHKQDKEVTSLSSDSCIESISDINVTNSDFQTSEINATPHLNNNKRKHNDVTWASPDRDTVNLIHFSDSEEVHNSTKANMSKTKKKEHGMKTLSDSKNNSAENMSTEVHNSPSSMSVNKGKNQEGTSSLSDQNMTEIVPIISELRNSPCLQPRVNEQKDNSPSACAKNTVDKVPSGKISSQQNKKKRNSPSSMSVNKGKNQEGTSSLSDQNMTESVPIISELRNSPCLQPRVNEQKDNSPSACAKNTVDKVSSGKIPSQQNKKKRQNKKKSKCLVSLSEDESGDDVCNTSIHDSLATLGMASFSTSPDASDSANCRRRSSNPAKRRDDSESQAEFDDWHKSKRWSVKEDKILRKNLQNFLKEYPEATPECLFTGFKWDSEEGKKVRRFKFDTNFYGCLRNGLSRTVNDIYWRARSSLAGQVKGRFSEAERQRLENLVNEYGKDWARIGLLMGRSAKSVSNHWNSTNSLSGTQKLGLFSEDEDKQLTTLVLKACSQHGSKEEDFSQVSWNYIAAKMGDRTAKQCRHRWMTHLWHQHKNKGEKEKWFSSDKIELINAVYESQASDTSPIDWSALLKKFDKVVSQADLQLKWHNLLRRVPMHRRSSLDDTLEYMMTTMIPEFEKKAIKVHTPASFTFSKK